MHSSRDVIITVLITEKDVTFKDVFCNSAALVLLGRHWTHRNVNDITERAGVHYFCSTRQRFVSLGRAQWYGLHCFSHETIVHHWCQATDVGMYITLYNNKPVLIASNSYRGNTLNWRAPSSLVDAQNKVDIRKFCKNISVMFLFFFGFLYASVLVMVTIVFLERDFGYGN